MGDLRAQREEHAVIRSMGFGVGIIGRSETAGSRAAGCAAEARSWRALLPLLLAVAWLAAPATANAVSFNSQTVATGSRPGSVATGDLNGDGQPDMVAANLGDGTVSVLLGNGDGTFQAQKTITVGGKPRGVAIGDFNGDGKPDLVVANENDNDVSVLLGNGDGTFQAQTTYAVGNGPAAVAVGDFNGDGIPDIVVTNEGLGCCGDIGTVSVLLGNGDGTFKPQQAFGAYYPGTALAVGDFNGDGNLDLAVGEESGSGGVAIYLGNGDGTFKAGGSYEGNQYDGASVAVGDFNGDGKLDLVTSNWGQYGTVSVLLGKGDGTFQAQTYDVTGGQGYGQEEGVVVADLNGDGIPDIAVDNESFNTIGVLLGKGDGTFGYLQTLSVGSIPTALASADFNGDGEPDLVVSSQFGNSADVLSNASFGFVSAETPRSDSTAGEGSVLINQFRLTGPSGPGDQYVELYNTKAAPVAVGGWELEGSKGGFTQLPYGTVIPGHGHLLLTGPSYSLSSTATSNGELPSGKLQEPAATADNGFGGFRLVATDGAVIDTVGFAHAQQLPTVWFDQFGYNQTGVGPDSVASGDLNGDGMPDLVVANGGTSASPGNTISVLTEADRLRGGDFNGAVSYTVGSHPTGVAVGDLNGDGKPDVVVANKNDGDVSVLLNNGDGTLKTQQTYAVGSDPNGVAIGDFNGDGKPDLVVANENDDDVSVLLGNGDGTFQSQTTYPTDQGDFPVSVAVGDFNGDGHSDLVVEGVGGLDVLLGNGDGTFQAEQAPGGGGVASGPGVVVGDFNGDGKLDIAAANLNTSAVDVLLGNGDGTFQAQKSYTVGSEPSDVAVGDFDGDGVPDLAVTNYTDGTVSMLFGYGDGTFAPQKTFTVGSDVSNPNGDPTNGPIALVAGNFDLYSKPGLAVVAANQPGVALLGNRINGGGKYYSKTGIAIPPAYPTGQFAWVRNFSNGQPVNTDVNAADFSYISTNDNDSAHGNPASGTPGPTNLSFGPLTVSGVAPDGGPAGGGNTVTITGSGFVPDASVRFGSNSSSSVTYISSTKLEAVAPAGSARVASIRVSTQYGTSALGNADLYAYGPPTVGSVSPNGGSAAGGNTVTITGNGFVPDTSVRFGSNSSSSVTFDSTTKLEAVVPAGSSRVVSVRVTTPAGTSTMANADLYAYGAPSVSGVSPNAGSAAGGNTVTITGNGFVPGATVRFGTNYSSKVTFVSTTELQAVNPGGSARVVSVRVSTPAGTSAASSADFYANGPPTLSRISPNSGPAAGGTTVTITGNGFVPGATVRFGSVYSSKVTFVSSTKIEAVAPAQAAGAVKLFVHTPAGWSPTHNALQYTYTG